jgi:hypothetical protein
VGLDKTGGNHRLYPVCKWEAITGQAFEFTARVQALGGFTHPPREAQEANQPAVPAQATPEQYDAALARASAAGYLMTHSVCFIESKGYRVTNWQAGYNFQVKGANGVNAALIYEAIGLFTHITGADSAQQNAVQQRSRSYSLTKRSDIQVLFTNLGIGETFEDRCQQMFDYQQEHKGNIQPMKIDVDLNALLPSVKSFICDNPQRIQNFLQNNQGYTEETAKAELEAAFQLGTEGNLW